MPTTFSNKTKILTAVWILYRNVKDDAGWQKFMELYDMSLPLSSCVVAGWANLTKEGKEVINQTWNTACQLLSVDPNGTYTSYDDIVGASPNEAIIRD